METTRFRTGWVTFAGVAANSASLAVFMIFVAPIWALVVLAIDLTVIWALLAGTDEFDTA